MSPSKPATPTADIHEKENAGCVEKCFMTSVVETVDADCIARLAKKK
jgi:hypothetical protein